MLSDERVMWQRLRNRKEWTFFSVLPKADGPLAVTWWCILLLRGILPALFAISMGVLVAAVQHGASLAGPLTSTGIVFVLLQVLTPIHQAVGANLGDRTAAWLYDVLTEACVRPAGMGHLEDPTLTSDLTVARDFDLGMTGPPLSISMDFIAGGLVEFVAGVASAAVLFAFAWWAPLVLAGGWLATHWLLRESAVWHDRNTEEVRGAQRDADYAYRLAVDPPASKELRLFGLAAWTIDWFIARRTRLHQLQYAATRLRERPLLLSVLLVLGANILIFWALGSAASQGGLSLGETIVFAQSAIGASMIAFGGLSWALDGAAAPVAAVLRLGPAMANVGGLHTGDGRAWSPAREIRFRNVTFAYPGGGNVLEGFDLTLAAGTSLAIVGQNGAGKTTLAKLLCRLYDPQSGAIEVDVLTSVPSIWSRGDRSSRLCSRTFSGWSFRFATTSRREARPIRWCSGHSNRQVPRISRDWTQCWPAAMTMAPSSRAVNGNEWPSRGRCAPWPREQAWCCSMSPPRSSTCAAKRRSSIGS